MPSFPNYVSVSATGFIFIQVDLFMTKSGFCIAKKVFTEREAKKPLKTSLCKLKPKMFENNRNDGLKEECCDYEAYKAFIK